MNLTKLIELFRDWGHPQAELTITVKRNSIKIETARVIPARGGKKAQRKQLTAIYSGGNDSRLPWFEADALAQAVLEDLAAAAITKAVELPEYDS